MDHECIHERIGKNSPPAKNKIPKPARIPPQTPPPRGRNLKSRQNKLAEVLRNPFPKKLFSQNRVRIEAPPHCLNTWKAEPQKEKCPFLF